MTCHMRRPIYYTYTNLLVSPNGTWSAPHLTFVAFTVLGLHQTKDWNYIKTKSDIYGPVSNTSRCYVLHDLSLCWLPYMLVIHTRLSCMQYHVAYMLFGWNQSTRYNLLSSQLCDSIFEEKKTNFYASYCVQYCRKPVSRSMYFPSTVQVQE